MRNVLGALALLLGTATMAQAEVIHPFSCRQFGGPAPDLTRDIPFIGLRKPGRILFICPIRDSFSGFRIRYSDDDGILGNSSVKAWITQTIFFNDTDLSRGPPNFGDPNGETCEYKSNFDPAHNNTFFGGIGELSCPRQVSSRSYQTLLVELWSRKRAPNVVFFGVETF